MKYTSKRDKIKDFIETKILTALAEADLDYDKVEYLIAQETGASVNMVRELLKGYIALGKIQRAKFFNPNTKKYEETNVLTIPDDKIEDWLKAQKLRGNKDELLTEQELNKILIDEKEAALEERK